MRKVFNKVVAGATSVALIATLALGVNFASSVKADDATTLAAPTWSFTQGGQYNPGEPTNTGYIKSVNVGDEVLSKTRITSRFSQQAKQQLVSQ